MCHKCPSQLMGQTVCASTLIFACTAVLCVLGCAGIAFFYAELNSVNSLSQQPLEAISYLLGEAIVHEVDNVIYSIAAATRLFAAKVVISSENSVEHDYNVTLNFLEILMRNDTFAQIDQISFVSGDLTQFASLTHASADAGAGSDLFASIVRQEDGCKEEFWYPSMAPYPAAGQNKNCSFNMSASSWFQEAQKSDPGELIWGMDVDAPTLLEAAENNETSQVQTYCALPISDDGKDLGTIAVLSYAPAVVGASIEVLMGSLVQTSSVALLSDTVLCVADRGSGRLLAAEVNKSRSTDAVEQCNKTKAYVEEHFGGSLKSAVSDMWIDNGKKVISTHTPALPVRLGRSGRIDWILWVCDDAEHLETEQRNSIVVTLAISLVGIITVGSIMYTRLRTVLSSPALQKKSLVETLHDINYRTHEVYVIVVIVVLIWWQVSNNAVIVDYSQIILEVSSLNTVREVSNMLSKPFILNNVLAEELPRLLTPNNMMTCSQENTGTLCADHFFFDGMEFDSCTSLFGEFHNNQLWCQREPENQSSWDRCVCETPSPPSSVFDNWLVENVFALTVFSEPVFSVGFGTSQGVYEEALASVNATFLDTFSSLTVYPASMLVVCNLGPSKAGDPCTIQFGSDFRGWASQKGVCRQWTDVIPNGPTDQLVCEPTAVDNTTSEDTYWRRSLALDSDNLHISLEPSFDELFVGSLVNEVVDLDVRPKHSSQQAAELAGSQFGLAESQRKHRRKLAGLETSCRSCDGLGLGDACSYTNGAGTDRYGYCGQYSAEQADICCLSYSIPEIAVQTCNFETENTTCRYQPQDLSMPVQGFCHPITAQMPMVPETILYCKPNYLARVLGSGPTPYGLVFSIIARDSTTDMQTLVYGTMQNDERHPYAPFDYPFSNTERDPTNVNNFGEETTSISLAPWFTEASNAQRVSGPSLFSDSGDIYVNLEVTKRIWLNNSGLSPTPEAVLRVFVDLAAATSILDFSDAFSLSNDDDADESSFCFVVADDGNLVLTNNATNLVNPSNSSQLVNAGDSENLGIAYVYTTLMDRFGSLEETKQWLPWIGKIGQGLDGGVYDVYLSSTEVFNVPGIANDTASFTVICALKHDESFKQILLWAYKATLIGVGIIFVHLILSRVIVKAIVFAFKRLRQRSVAGGVSRRIASKLSNSSEDDGDQMAFEMTATLFDQASTENNQPTSPSKRPKAAGLADFLYFYKGRMKNCRGPVIAENFLHSHENLAKWLIRKGAQGYCVEDLLPVLAEVDIRKAAEKRVGSKSERFVNDVQELITRRRASTVMEYSSVLQSMIPPGVPSGNRRSSLSHDQPFFVDKVAPSVSGSRAPAVGHNESSLRFRGHSGPKGPGAAQAGMHTHQSASTSDLPEESFGSSDGTFNDETPAVEKLTKPYDIQALYKTVQSFFDSKSLWSREDPALVEAAKMAAAAGLRSPAASDRRPAILRTRSYHGERFQDGALDLDDLGLDALGSPQEEKIPPVLTATTRRKLRHFNMHRSKTWARIINLTIFINCCVAFIEAPYVDRLTGRDDPRVFAALVVNFCCYTVYFVEFYLNYVSSGFRVLRVDDEGRKFEMRMNTVLIAWIVLTSAMAIEWLVTLFDPNFNTGLNQEFYETNGLDLQAGWFLFLPYTSILRPVLFILTSRSIRDCISSFTTTIVIYLKVFSLLAILLLLMALLGILIQPSGVDNLDLDGFNNFVAALIYSFDFLGSHENYPDVVYTRTGVDYAFSQILMIVSSIIGVVFVDALIISVFSEKYSEVAAVLKTQRHRCRRTAIVAAFMVLDESADNTLDQRECQGFFRDYWQFVDHFDDNNDHMLDVREFVGICEAFLDNNNTVLRTFYESWDKEAAARRKRERRCCNRNSRHAQACRDAFVNKAFGFWTTIMLFANAYLLFWYGILSSPVDCVNQFGIDMGAFAFMLYWFTEVLVRFAYFGAEMWNKPRDIYNQMKNRFEVIVSVAGVVGFAGVVIYKRYVTASPDENYFNILMPIHALQQSMNRTTMTPEYLDWHFDAAGRLCYMVPLLRLLSTFPAVSRLFFGLLAILPIFWDVYATGVIIFYMFAALGVLMFFGKYQVLLGDANEIPDATFDSFLHSIFVCFNLFNGESWDLLMEAGVNSTGLWYMSVYFVIQMVLLNMLFQDLITGIIIDASRNLSDLFEDDETAKVDTFAFWERLTHTRNDVVSDGNNDGDGGSGDDSGSSNLTLGEAISKVLSVDFGDGQGLSGDVDLEQQQVNKRHKRVTQNGSTQSSETKVDQRLPSSID